MVKLMPWERIGQLRCTLGQTKTEREESACESDGRGANQRFPEVYIGLSLEIHRGFTTMCGQWRQVMDAQYVWFEVSPRDKAPVLGLTTVRYFDVLRMLKAYLSGYLHLDNSTITR